MAATSPVILVELNELAPPLMNRFIAEGHLPSFARLERESLVFTTDAQEQGENLNPWIQWVTVHTGLTFAEHGVFRLGEGDAVPVRTLTELASEAGLRVWQCGSMNVRSKVPLDGAVLPDPWSAHARPYPDDLAPFFRFVQQNVQEHTNERVPLTWADYARFGWFMLTHGLRPATVASIGRQLLRERSGRYGWQRVAILDRLQWDVFSFYYRRLRPHFSTFFSNSVAHLQHTHWREFEPEKFRIQPSAEEREEFSQAVLFGYRKIDEIIGKALELAGPDATLIFCTALSQQPCVSWEEVGGKSFHRPRRLEDLVQFAGIEDPCTCAPVMSEEFSLLFRDEAAAQRASERLAALTVGSEKAFWASAKGSGVYGGCRIYRTLPADAVLHDPSTGRSVPFASLLYQADTLKSGVHHPDGMLWIRTPRREHRVVPEKVSLAAIAPTILSLLGLAQPEYMRAKPLG
jgi:hypothetical protein